MSNETKLTRSQRHRAKLRAARVVMVQVRLSAEAAAALDRLCAATGQTRSEAVAELLEPRRERRQLDL